MSTFATTSKCIEKQSCLPVGLGLLAFLVILRLLRHRYIKQLDTKSSTLAEHSNDVGTVSAHRWLSLRDCLRSASTHCSSRSSYSKHVLLGLILATIAQYCSDWLSRQATINSTYRKGSGIPVPGLLDLSCLSPFLWNFSRFYQSRKATASWSYLLSFSLGTSSTMGRHCRRSSTDDPSVHLRYRLSRTSSSSNICSGFEAREQECDE